MPSSPKLRTDAIRGKIERLCFFGMFMEKIRAHQPLGCRRDRAQTQDEPHPGEADRLSSVSFP